MNETTSERLEMRWLPVTDAAGRTRMEATWVTVPPPSPLGSRRSATPPESAAQLLAGRAERIALGLPAFPLRHVGNRSGPWSVMCD